MVGVTNVATAMTIAGSDSSGGAGIQADLKTFAALGVYGSSVVTAITAQNTLKVIAVHEVPVETVEAQIDAVLTDIGADAVKTGMLLSTSIIEAVAEKMKFHEVKLLVVDPVMVAKSGDRLLRPDAISALQNLLIPLATVVTPNVPEAEVLAGMKIDTSDAAWLAARRIVELGAKVVVIKGGHLPGEAIDRLYDGETLKEFCAPRVDTNNTHGTGCTFASAIAAGLAKGRNIVDAVEAAKDYVTQTIKSSYSLGQGHGPLNHFVERSI